jgi:hypothetical protein
MEEERAVSKRWWGGTGGGEAAGGSIMLLPRIRIETSSHADASPLCTVVVLRITK